MIWRCMRVVLVVWAATEMSAAVPMSCQLYIVEVLFALIVPT